MPHLRVAIIGPISTSTHTERRTDVALKPTYDERPSAGAGGRHVRQRATLPL